MDSLFQKQIQNRYKPEGIIRETNDILTGVILSPNSNGQTNAENP